MCSYTSGCSAVTVTKNGDNMYECFRKSDVDPSSCDHGTTYDTYIHDGTFYI